MLFYNHSDLDTRGRSKLGNQEKSVRKEIHNFKERGIII